MAEGQSGQELENLLISIDSELGNLQGLESAITSLQRLANFTKDATSGIKQLGQLGKAFHSFDNLKLDGLSEATKGVQGLVSALDSLSKVGKVAERQFKDFGKLGDTLRTSFNGIGQSLQGIEQVATGVNGMVQALASLSTVQRVTKSTINNLGNLGDAIHHFNGLDKEIAKIVDPIKDLMTAIGNLGNNNKVSIRIDTNGVAHVNQVMRNTRRQMTSFAEFMQTLRQDRNAINFDDMFDISQPTEDLQRNLTRAQRMLVTFENRARDSIERIHSATANFNLGDLQNNQSFRNAFRTNVMSDVMAEQMRQGIDRISQELETRGAQEIADAWRHTQESIIHDSTLDLSELINPNLPLEQIRANMRQLQNELSRAESSMQRAFTELGRLRSLEQDEQRLRSQQSYRTASYTYATNARHVEQYRRAIEQLQGALHHAELFPQDDAQLLRQIPQLEEQIRRFQGMYDNLLNNDNRTAEQDNQLSTYEEGLTILRDRLQHIHELLEQIPQTEEGVLEIMRQTADETERLRRETEQTNNAMREAISNGFSQFGSMLSRSGNGFLGSLGNLSSLFGREVQSGTAVLSGRTIPALQGVASVLGRIATGVGQVVAVANVFLSVFRGWWSLMGKIRNMLAQFVQSLKDFAKNMLNNVVGAFNAVAGAVSKTVSAVKSGAEAINSALRKIGEHAQKVISILGKIGGGAVSGLVKSAKAIANLIAPKTLRNLLSADGSLKNIVKNTRLLNKALQVANKWFTMLTRMLMRKIVQAFISGLKQAFEDMVMFEKEAGDAMMQLNYNVSIVFSALRRLANQVLAIFEPIINAVAMPVESFLTGLQTMAENMAKFMAILTGQPYYLRAKKFYWDYGENLDKTTKKAKNLTNSLDELNILNDKSSESTDVDPLVEFEKVDIEGGLLQFPDISSILTKIKDWLAGIDWEKIRTWLENFIDRVMSIINQVLRDIDLWGLLGDTLAEIINTLVDAWLRIIQNFDPVATAKAIAEFIIRALSNLDWESIHEAVSETATKFAQFLNEIFANDALWDEIVKAITNGLNEVVHYFNDFAWTFDFEGLARQLTRSLTNLFTGFDYEQLRSAVEGWVTGIVDFINTVASDKQFWKTLGTSIANTINATIIEAISDLADIDFKDLTNSVKLAIENALKKIDWNEFNKSLKEWGKNLADIINGIFGDAGFLTTITESFAKFTNGVIGLLDEFITKLKGYNIGKAIAEALGNGLSDIDWETAFLLPAKAINTLSDAIRGFLDGLPKDFNLGDWIAEHLNLTMEAIKWEEIAKNFDDLSKKINEWLNGLLKNEEFWTNAGELTGNVIDIGINFLFNLVNFKGEDLGTAIKNYINGLISKVNIGEVLSRTVDVALNLLVALDVALRGIDWKTIGDQITQGIINAINRVYANRGLIKQTIEDAFAVFNNFIYNLVNRMIQAGSFAKLGDIIGTTLLAVINGVADFFEMNINGITTGMKQLADSLADFITRNEQEIVDGLNTIIDGLVAILETFLDEKSKLYQKFIDIVEQLHLADLISVLLRAIIQGIVSTLKLNEAIWKNLTGDLDKLVDALWKAVKPIFSYIGGKIKEKLKEGLIELIFGDMSDGIPFFDLTGGGLIGLLQKLFGKGDPNKRNGVTNWQWWKKEDAEDTGESWLDKLRNFFTGDKGKVEVPIEPVVDEDGLYKLEDFARDKNVELQFEDANLGKIKAHSIQADIFEGKTIKVTDIFADTLTVVDIIGDKLKIKEIETEKGVNEKKLDEYYGANDYAIRSGSISKDAEFENIKAKLLEVEKIVAKLLESEKITSLLLKVEKIVATLLTVANITATTLTAQNLNVDTISANILNLSNITAKTLTVDNINGNISGVSGNNGGGTVDNGYFIDKSVWTPSSGWQNLNLEKPQFDVGDRWSDISGAVESAEDFIDSLSYTIKDGSGNVLHDQILSSVHEMPKFLADNDSNVSGGTIGNNKGLSDFDRKMADTLAGAQIKNLPANAEYIRDYLMSFIGNEAGVYGLMGNLYAESGLLTNNLQDTKRGEGVTQKDIDYTNSINNGGNFLDNKGYGLAQWTTSDRKKALLNSLNGRSVDDLDAQLEYLKSELMSSQYKDVLEKLRNASSIEEASDATLYGFEKPKVKDEAQAGLRLAYGQDLAGQLGSYEGELPTPQEVRNTEGINDVDRPDVIDTKSIEQYGINPIPIRIEYAMAEIYNIIDKWLGRIIKLIKSFTDFDFFDGLLNNLTGFDFIDSRFFDDILVSLNLILDNLNDIKDKEFICKCNKDNDYTHLDNNTKAKSANTKAVEENTKAIMDLIHNGLGNITCNCDCGGNCGDCAMGQKENIVLMPENYAPLDLIGETVKDISDTLDDVKNNTSPSNRSGSSSGGGGGTTKPSNNGTGTTGGGGTTKPSSGSSTSGGGGTTKPSRGSSSGVSYRSADMLSLLDSSSGKEYKLYVTLEGERFSVGKDMPKDIRERLMNGEGTLDLDGVPLSAFKGKFSSSGFDVSKDSSWRSMMKKLWGGGLSDNDLTIPNGNSKGSQTSEGGKPSSGTVGGGQISSGNEYYGFDHTGESLNNNTSNNTGTSTDDGGKTASGMTEHNVTTPSNYADAIADAQSGWTQNDGGNPVSNTPSQTETPVENKPAQDDEKLKNQKTPDARTGEIKDGYGNVVGHVDGYWKDAEGNGSYWLDGNKVSYEDYLKNPKNNPSSNIAKASGKTFSDDFASNYAWSTADVKTGKTNYYDADGNLIASVDTKDVVAKQNEKKAEAIKKAEEERVANEKAKNEEARKKKNESTPIIYQGTDNLIGGVLTDEVKAQREAYTKTVEEYRKKAKEFMDIINKNGTDTQKASAENYFNSLNTNKASHDASPYKFNYDKLEDIANQVKVANAFGEDYKNIRVQTNGGIFAIKDLLKTESGQLALADVLDKYEKGKEVRFYKQGNGSSNSANKSDRITDEETVKDLISKLKSLGIDAKSAKEETSTESTTPEEGTDTASQIDKFVNLFKKQAKIMKNPVSDEAIKLFNSAGIQAGAKILFADGKRLTSVTPWQKANSYASYAREKRILEDEVANNVDVKGFYFNNAESSNPKSDFEKWYKDSFLVRGYQMGGLPNSGELFISRENGTPEFVGSFGNKTAVANNDQIVTAVANGVSMANDRVVNAIHSQTNSLEDAIDKKDLDVQIGDRQIAEANRRGEKGLGGSFIK